MPKLIKEASPQKTFTEFLRESADKDQAFRERILLFEHEVYKLIPGSNVFGAGRWVCCSWKSDALWQAFRITRNPATGPA